MELSQATFEEHTPSESELEGGLTLVPERQSLLRARIKDLKLQLAGTPLERLIQQLYSELAARQIDLRPQCYLSDEWGCPSGVPVIGVPFYLANPHLHLIEEELGGGFESENDIRMTLRHEAGHAFCYAYKLYETLEWRALFGDYDAPYRDDFKAKPFSRKYVVHIPGWYAQKHPDEDFAETFAVWMTPESQWRERYKAWPALKKLQYVEEMVQRLGHAPALVQLSERDLEVNDMEQTVADFYRLRDLDEKVDVALGEKLDQELLQLFEPSGKAEQSAYGVLKRERQNLIQAVSQFAGVNRAVVRSVVDHLLVRLKTLDLRTGGKLSSPTLARLSALVTALVMNYLYTGRFVDTDDNTADNARRGP